MSDRGRESKGVHGEGYAQGRRRSQMRPNVPKRATKQKGVEMMTQSRKEIGSCEELRLSSVLRAMAFWGEAMGVCCSQHTTTGTPERERERESYGRAKEPTHAGKRPEPP